jgi:cytochrome c oxidase subunit 2
MKRDTINVGILWFVLTFVGELLLPTMDIFPFLASEEGELIDEAFFFLMIMGIPVFTFVISVLVYSVFRFRDRGETEQDGPPMRTSTAVYAVWLVVTGLLALVILIHPGITGIAELRASTEADLVVQVAAEQWNWDFTYPEYDLTIAAADELVLPVDTRVKFEVTGKDILHSFWIPAFRLKIDAVPGQTTVLYVTPTVISSFDDDANMRVQCAELCGTGHTRMRTHVSVVTASEFETWIASQVQAQNSETVSAAGQ